MNSDTSQEIKKKKKWFIPVIIAAVLMLFAFAIAVIVIISTVAVPTGKLKKQLDLGDKYITDMDYENAVLAYREAIQIDPKCEEAYLALGDASLVLADKYLEDGDTEGAIKQIKRAIRELEQGYDNTDSDEIKDKIKEMEEKKDEIENEDKEQEQDSGLPDSDEDSEDAELMDKVARAYAEFLDNPANSGDIGDLQYYDINDPNLRFDLAYIDADDVPELVIDYTGYWLCVCYYRDGKVNVGFSGAYGTWGNIFYFKEKSGYIYNSPYGYEYTDDGVFTTYCIYFYPATDLSLPSYQEMSRTWTPNNGSEEVLETKFYSDDNEISEQEYNDGIQSFGFDFNNANLKDLSGLPQKTKSEMKEQLSGYFR